jgi:hypothetical protein
MEIVSIFVVVNDSLYSVAYDIEDESAFQALFNRWQDVEYLEQFFEDNKTDLESGFYGNITIEEAVLQTLEESARFEQKILKSAKSGNSDPSEVLEEVIFTSLHKDVYSHKYIESKAHGPNKKSWLRVYAIRIAPNLYFVSGGSIKLTEAMTPDHLKLELKKLKATVAFLKEIGLEVEEDLGYIEIGNDDTD